MKVSQRKSFNLRVLSCLPLRLVLIVLILQLFDTDFHAILWKHQILAFHLPLAVFGQIVCEDIYLLRGSRTVSITSCLGGFPLSNYVWGELTWYPIYARPPTTANRITRGMRLPRTPIMTPCNEQCCPNERVRKSGQDRACTEILVIWRWSKRDKIGRRSRAVS